MIMKMNLENLRNFNFSIFMENSIFANGLKLLVT